MLLIRIDFNDKKYALISAIKIKNALTLTMGEEYEEEVEEEERRR